MHQRRVPAECAVGKGQRNAPTEGGQLWDLDNSVFSKRGAAVQLMQRSGFSQALLLITSDYKDSR